MMSEWQPIASVNREAADIFHPVLVAARAITEREALSVTVAFWDKYEQGWLDAMNHDGYQHASVDPLYWMPFPAPPSQAP
jgi:hypothetical protein